jgi:hypothetical protein
LGLNFTCGSKKAWKKLTQKALQWLSLYQSILRISIVLHWACVSYLKGEKRIGVSCQNCFITPVIERDQTEPCENMNYFMNMTMIPHEQFNVSKLGWNELGRSAHPAQTRACGTANGLSNATITVGMIVSLNPFRLAVFFQSPNS